ncbi:hypothetical protein [Pseudorhodoplanes sp.]|uniref:hypothetical protein n=1 Tax=Pseudorhodoplanes sp. TaxID=1934341 RepID=UPI003D10650C
MPKASVAGAVIGLLVAAIGFPFVLMASGLLPAKGANAPLWVLGAAGMAFVLAGASVTLSALAGSTARDGTLPDRAPFALHVLQLALGLGIVAMLALAGTWVALGAGGGFRSAMSIGGASLSGPANETMARFVFGFGALVTWAIFVAFAVRGWRKLRARMQQ